MSVELAETKLPCKIKYLVGGDAGIRTLDTALRPYNGLANRRLQPLGHVSGRMRCFERFSTRLARLICKSAIAAYASPGAGLAFEDVGNDIEEHVDPNAGKQ